MASYDRKTIEIPSIVIAVRAVFHKNNKYYPQMFLDECLYKLQKKKLLNFDRIDTSEKLILIKQANQECEMCHYWYFLNKGFKFQPIVCDRCHDLLMMSMNRSDIAISNIKSADYCCIISGVSKSKAINVMQNADLNKKEGTL